MKNKSKKELIDNNGIKWKYTGISVENKIKLPKNFGKLKNKQFPMNISLWKQIGKERKYFDYFEKKIREDCLKQERKDLLLAFNIAGMSEERAIKETDIILSYYEKN